MKKWLMIGAAILVVAVAGKKPSAGTDIGMLQPVQIVLVKQVGTDVVVQTDTKNQGSGSDFMEAVENMKATSSGEIFLETAEHLLIDPECMNILQDAAKLLRPSCSVCLVDGEPDLETLGDYLKLHAPSRTLMEYMAGESVLQTLITQQGRTMLVS